MSGYDATVTREEDLWVAEVFGLPENVLSVFDDLHFADLLDAVPDLIAGLTDTDPADVAIRWRYEINGWDVTDVLHRFLAIKAETNERLVAREAARREAIRALSEAGLSRRATGDAVGLSGGRVQQLTG
ncbi:MAG: hypothetical protein ACRDPW_10725 [Mycobacteriales bacterium]